MTRVVVADTGPLNYLILIGTIDSSAGCLKPFMSRIS